MIENAERFFALYDRDEALRERVAEAEACYPGSLEIREDVAECVLLPIAEELGLPFTVKDLRAYETRLKLSRIRPAGIPEEGEEMLSRADALKRPAHNMLHKNFSKFQKKRNLGFPFDKRWVIIL